MSTHREKRPSDAQAQYAHLRALIDIRLAEVQAALDRHEANRMNWQRPGTLASVDGRLAELLSFLEGRGGYEDLIARYRRLRAWVARARRARGDRRATQRELRRMRLCEEVSPVTLRELLRELRNLE